MKKILFINPSIRNTVFGKMKMLALPPMGLGILASRTPEKYDVSIIDENVDQIDFDTDPDLVAGSDLGFWKLPVPRSEFAGFRSKPHSIYQ